MAALITRVNDLVTRAATECKSLRNLLNGNASDLSGLTTTTKTNLVAAVNELKTLIDDVEAAAGASIDDAVTVGNKTWSSSKISQEITDAVDGILNGVPAALDTLEELANAIGDDANFATTITAALGNRLRADINNQGLTTQQKLNVCTNAGIGDPDTNFVTTFEAGLV